MNSAKYGLWPMKCYTIQLCIHDLYPIHNNIFQNLSSMVSWTPYKLHVFMSVYVQHCWWVVHQYRFGSLAPSYNSTSCRHKMQIQSNWKTTNALWKQFWKTPWNYKCFFCEVLHSWLNQGFIRARGHELHCSTVWQMVYGEGLMAYGVWRWFVGLICRV